MKNGYAYSLNGYGCSPALMGFGAITFNTTPTSDWSCSDWKFWHEELVKAFMAGRFASQIRYSQQEAIRLSNQVFMQHWERLSGFFTKHQFCGYESQFFHYFKSVGLDNILSYFQAVITPTAESAGTITENVTDTASTITENVADTASSATKTLKWLVPTLLVGAGVALSFYVYNNFIKEKKPATA